MALARSLALAGTCLVIFVVVFAGLPFPSFHASWLIATVPLSVAGTAGWLVTLLRPRAVPGEAVWAASLVVLAAGLSAFASDRPDVALPTLWKIGAGAGTALLIWHTATRPRSRRDLLAIGVMFLVVFMVVYLIQVIGHWTEWLRLGLAADQLPLRPGGSGGIAGLPTWLADQVLVLTPLAVAAIGWSSRRSRLAAGAVLAGAVITVTISGTRSLWLIAVLLAAPVAVAWIRGRGVSPRLLVAGGLIAVAAIAVAAWRFDLVTRLGRDADAGRTAAYSSALEIGRSAPILGTGPGTYPLERLEMSVPVFQHTAFPNAHNLLLNSFAELGLVGLALVLVAAALLGLRVWSNYRGGAGSRGVIVAAALGVGIVLGHAMVDVVIDVPGIFLMTALVSTFALIPPPGGAGAVPLDGVRRWSTRVAVAVVIVLLAGSLPSIVRQERNVRLVEQARNALDTNPAASLSHARAAQDGSPGFGPAVLLEMQAADRVGDLPAAIDAGRRAVALDGLSQHSVNLAVLLSRSGDARAAREELDVLGTRGSTDPFVLLNVAAIEASDPEAATSALTRWLQLDPPAALVIDQLPASLQPFAIAAVDAAVRSMAEAGSIEAALLVRLATGAPPAVTRALIQEAPSASLGWLEAVDAAWRGSREGLATVEGIAAARPGPDQVRMAWLLAARSCDAARTERWAAAFRLIGNGDSPAVPVELGTSPAVRASMQPNLYPAAVWSTGVPDAPYVTGTLTYRRGTPGCDSRLTEAPTGTGAGWDGNVAR